MADFQIHRQAIKLKSTLQQLLAEKGKEYEVEITSIYDSPIRICNEVLDYVQSGNHLDTIDGIKQKYWLYQDRILTQFDDDFFDCLCEDMKKCS